jgi:hypothetical protein
MDIGKAITFVTEDENWLKKAGVGTGVVLISMLLSPVLVGILGFFILSGYAIRLLQNVRDGKAQPLPEWDEWGGDLSRGFKYVIVTLVWSLAAYLMMVPMFIGGALADSGGAGEFIGSAIMICTSCLLMLYGIFVALAAPGFTISFAHDERIGSGLKVTNIWQWTRANLGQVIIVMLVIMAVSFIVSMLAGIVGLILCVIGLAVTIPLSVLFLTVFQYHLYGQLAREHPMYDSPSAVPAPLVPSDPEGTDDDVPGAELHASEQTVIVPPAPEAYSQSESAGEEIAADEVADTGDTSDEVDASVVAVDERIDATAEQGEESIEAIASEVSESTDEIAAGVDDVVNELVEAGSDAVDETVDEINTTAGSVADEADSNHDSDPNQKPKA